MRPTVVLFLWWRSRISIYRKAISSTRATSTFRTVMPAMTLKNAALLALIGTILITALLVWDFVFNVLNVFFYVFHIQIEGFWNGRNLLSSSSLTIRGGPG